MSTNHLPSRLQQSLQYQLRSVVDHLHAIRRMVDNGAACQELLVELSVARGELKRVESELLAAHIDACVREAIYNGLTDATLDRLRAALAQTLK